MNEAQALAKMIAPGMIRPGKWRNGILQIHVTRICDRACPNCTQGSQLRGPYPEMSVEQFEQACISLKGYFGVVGLFGGNPPLARNFAAYCELLRKHFPRDQCGLWSNNPITPEKAQIMRQTFNPGVSNLNVHLDRKAFDMFRQHWPESRPFGLDVDSRHSPPYVAMKDVLFTICNDCSGNKGIFTAPNGDRYLTDPSSTLGLLGVDVKCTWEKCQACNGTGKVYDEERAWDLIGNCDINIHWSALIGVFRGQLRAWFCEIAGGQSMLHQDEPDYPDTGLDPNKLYSLNGRMVKWWQLPMTSFREQVLKHCHECGIPLKGFGAQACDSDPLEQVSPLHASMYKPKSKDRRVEIVTTSEQLGETLKCATDYVGNVRRPKHEVII